MRARDEYDRFCAAHPDVATAWVHVIEERPLSRFVAAQTGVTHESPQALLLACGKVVWHASHDAITVESLTAAVAS